MFGVQNLLWNPEKAIILSVEKPEEKSKPEKGKFVKKTSVTKKLDAKKKEVAKTAKPKAKGEKQMQEAI